MSTDIRRARRILAVAGLSGALAAAAPAAALAQGTTPMKPGKAAPTKKHHKKHHKKTTKRP